MTEDLNFLNTHKRLSCISHLRRALERWSWALELRHSEAIYLCPVLKPWDPRDQWALFESEFLRCSSAIDLFHIPEHLPLLPESSLPETSPWRHSNSHWSVLWSGVSCLSVYFSGLLHRNSLQTLSAQSLCWRDWAVIRCLLKRQSSWQRGDGRDEGASLMENTIWRWIIRIQRKTLWDSLLYYDHRETENHFSSTDRSCVSKTFNIKLNLIYFNTHSWFYVIHSSGHDQII